ncbi:VWA domain-containing protein [Candidatus Liberibacter brunswickensis]
MCCFKIKKNIHDCKGSISLLTAIILTAIIFSIVMAVECSHAFWMKIEIHSILDRSLLNVATQIKNVPGDDQYKNKTKDMIRRNWYVDFRNELITNGFIKEADDLINSTSLFISQEDNRYNLVATSQYKMPLNFLTFFPSFKDIGHIKVPVISSIKINYDINYGMDIMIVLDVSGSMKIILPPKIPEKRIDVATKYIISMLDNMGKKIDVNNFIRSGLVTFSDKIVEIVPLSWGIKNVRSKIKNVIVEGGTNTTPGLRYAYNEIFSLKEVASHLSKGHNTYKKNIIFLTDGDNNTLGSNYDSLKLCKAAKEQGAVIYAIGIQIDSETANKFLEHCASQNGFFKVKDLLSDMSSAFTLIRKDMLKKNLLYDK